MALSLLVVVVADFLLVESVKGRMTEFSTTFNKAVSEVLNADRDLYQARVAELEILRAKPGSEHAQAIHADYQENAQQAVDRMHQFMALVADYPDIVIKLNAFDNLYADWLQKSGRVFELHASGDIAAAATLLDGESLKAFGVLRATYNLAGEAADAKIGELQTATLSQIKTQTWAIGLFSLAVFIAAMVIALVGPQLMSRAIRRVTSRIQEITEGDGDLTARIESSRRDEIGDLARQFNAFIGRIDQTLISVRTSTLGVNTAASEISNGSQDLASRTEQAASNLQETSASMEQIASTVGNTSDASQQANKLAQSTVEIARQGEQAMQQVERTMEEISASAAQISEIISLIDGIAFQTNILALNASVEAARAGEHGRGFAVVAQEVRTLASRSSDASKSIRTLIDTSVERTQSGASLVKSTGKTMQDIVKSVEQVTDVIGEISAGTKEQSLGISQVNVAVTDLDNMTQHNAAMVEQFGAAAGEMREQAERLNALIASFKLSATAEAPPSTRQIAGIAQRPTQRGAKPAGKPPSKAALSAEADEWAAF
ncbi:methyl-accepting chemotaxis protein [Halomonas sp. HP20-15]|uniref:methyl-accepting chemotaxis protein n=1 Tax=Halomonas sp. HP20-15 TaxID=3085901 RepID=UPI0039932781